MAGLDGRCTLFYLLILFAAPTTRGQGSSSETERPTPLDPTDPAGSREQVIPDCSCQRVIECSIHATFTDDTGTTVVPYTTELRCDIGSTDVPEVVMGEATMMLGMGSGSDMMAATASHTFIDNSFDVSVLSPGSFLFLREIGYIPRSQGLTSCSLQDTDRSGSNILSQYLNLHQLTIVYENNLNQYRTIAMDTNQLGQPDSLAMHNLDDAQRCAVSKIILALRSPVSQQQYFCRSDTIHITRETIATFAVLCS